MEILGVITIGGAALGALAVSYLVAEALIGVRADLKQNEGSVPTKSARW